MKNAFAHQVSSEASLPGWSTWNLRPEVLLVLGILALWYGIAYRRGRSQGWVPRSKSFILYFYFTGWLVLLIALVSPIDSLSDALAWVHMLQHTLILMVAAPLMALGGPHVIAPRALVSPSGKHPRGFRLGFLKAGHSLARFYPPLLAWLLYSLTLWIWHIPKLYEAALAQEWLHDIQHLAFFVTAYLFWRVLFDPFQPKLRPLVGILYAFIASLHGIILGVFMALSPKLWYDSYRFSPLAYGITPLEDQQLAGLIMWMPAGLAYVAVSVYLIVSLLSRKDRKDSPSPSENR